MSDKTETTDALLDLLSKIEALATSSQKMTSAVKQASDTILLMGKALQLTNVKVESLEQDIERLKRAVQPRGVDK